MQNFGIIENLVNGEYPDCFVISNILQNTNIEKEAKKVAKELYNEIVLNICWQRLNTPLGQEKLKYPDSPHCRIAIEILPLNRT